MILKRAALAGLVLAALLLFLVGLAAKERDNRFCVSCHLSEEKPLHEEKFNRFLASASRDLAGVHHAKKAVICIDCHGGADLPMRLQVWAVAAYDTVKFLAGRFKEPDHMRLPLRDKECSQCHTPILKSVPKLSAEQEEALEGRVADSYHGIKDHDTVKVACVRCHTSHTADGGAKTQFLARPRVQPICLECHKSLGD